MTGRSPLAHDAAAETPKPDEGQAFTDQFLAGNLRRLIAGVIASSWTVLDNETSRGRS